MNKQLISLTVVVIIISLLGLLIFTMFLADARLQEISDLKDEIAYRDEMIAEYREEFTEMETAIEIIMDYQRANKQLIEFGIYIDLDGNVFYQSENYYEEFDAVIASLENYVNELEQIIAANEILLGDDWFIQLWSDVDDAIEVIIMYYETTDQSVSLNDWFETNYPTLYARIMGYDDLYYEMR